MVVMTWLWKDLGTIGDQGELIQLSIVNQHSTFLLWYPKFLDIDIFLSMFLTSDSIGKVGIFTCRKTLQRSGKDHTIILVMPSGIYHYKFIVDGNVRYNPDLPCESDEMGHVCNLLDVHVSSLCKVLTWVLTILWPCRPTKNLDVENCLLWSYCHVLCYFLLLSHFVILSSDVILWIILSLNSFWCSKSFMSCYLEVPMTMLE